MKSEFVFNDKIYKQIDKEEVIFYIEGGYDIFVITKALQDEVLSVTKYFTNIIPYGMIFDSKGNNYNDFLNAMNHYFKNVEIPLNAYVKCYYYIIKSAR